MAKQPEGHLWVYRGGKWDKRAGLVDHDYLLRAALLSDPHLAHIKLHRSRRFGRMWWRVYWRSRLRVLDFWKSLNTDQKLMVWATITSTILSIISLVVSIMALTKN